MIKHSEISGGKIILRAYIGNALFILVLFLCKSAASQGVYTISGRIVDAKTGCPLPSANVRVSGSAKGTITNLDGSYLISLPAGEYTLFYSYVGYQMDSAVVRLAGNVREDVKLQPADILFPEVVSIAEDPAYAIIRKAIEKKHEWAKLLRSYDFKAFTRLTIYRDTALAGITESYTDGYWQEGDSLREVVTQKRETKNLPEAGLIPFVGEIVNFTDDLIEFAGYKFVGPIAENAFDYCKYRLLRTFTKNNVAVYEIEVIPDSRIVPLFSGKISIADSSYAVMGVDFRPNEAFNIPFLTDLKVNFAQHYSLYEGKFWMPADIITDFGMKIQFAGISLPRITINETSDIYDYRLNDQIADSILKKPVLVIDSSATKFDSTFWSAHEVLPLTLAEEKAYNTLDSTQTLAKQFKPTGVAAKLFDKGGPLSVLKYVDVRFNRVEGLFLGGIYTYTSERSWRMVGLSNEGFVDTSGSGGWSLSAAAGYGISDKIFKWRVGGDYPFADHVKSGAGAEVHRDIDHYPEDNFFSSFTTTITSLFGCNDYYNYYMAYGWSAHYSIVPIDHLNLTATYLSEDETSVVNHTEFSILALGNAYRPNPPIMSGEMRSAKISIRYGDEEAPLGILPTNAVELNAEYSSPSFLASNFHFGRYHLTASYHFDTFLKNYLFPPQTQVMFAGGYSTGTLPVQREFVLDSQIGGLAPFGVLKTARPVEFAGDKFAMVSVEQNFRNVPFLLLGIPFLYKKGMELLIDASAAQSWLNGVSTTNGWYYEAGVGLGKILGLIRMDLTYRLSKPNDVYFSVGMSSIL
ncbi:MAG TPA: DUF5686 family protein [Candidatus Acidoferrales bacterium]|nr:DUF5686 family protein [Candidatus Acidoferrales bacterium]